ncbi:MAG: NADH-quinone oxidoreductase subunit H [Thermomicrobiales bacterium]|nr:NADH-quinone oxidoreductase subunit H [Thermomicrobiales bacterium]
MYDLLLLLLQIGIMVGIAPLLQGLIKLCKARLQGRTGPPLLQPYRDLAKQLRRESVVSDQASWVFRYAPIVYVAGLLGAAMLVPTVSQRSPLGGFADAIVFIGLLALARFALALAALDTGSNFGGMGASREMTFAALIEPAIILVLLIAALPRQSTNFSTMAGETAFTIAGLLAMGAMAIVIIAETGRIPVDNPDTHLELTMAHEGMLLEYSGRPLGMVMWATQVRQITFIALSVALFLPWGMAPLHDPSLRQMVTGLVAFLAKIALIGVVLAVIESSVAKLRIFRAPDLLGLASVLGVLAVMATYVVSP